MPISNIAAPSPHALEAFQYNKAEILIQVIFGDTLTI